MWRDRHCLLPAALQSAHTTSVVFFLVRVMVVAVDCCLTS